MICEALICGKHANRLGAYVNLRKLQNVQPLAHSIRVQAKKDDEGRVHGSVKYFHTEGCDEKTCRGHDQLACEAITEKERFCSQPAKHLVWYFPDEQAKLLGVNPAAVTFSLPRFVVTKDVIYPIPPKQERVWASDHLKEMVCNMARDTMSLRQIETFLHARNIVIDRITIFRILRAAGLKTMYRRQC